jgi:uncharacterized protein YegJ (DUF2314 family)
MTDSISFFAPGDDAAMLAAYKNAQDNFKYFWRELSWEYRRIIPALDMAAVKVAFMQDVPGEDEPLVEHMWVNEIDFDGDTITGVLINTPNDLTNIENGDEVTIPLTQISDWLIICEGKPYGGYTMQVMRAQMDEEEREEHDAAWGLEFPDNGAVYVVRNQTEEPENLVEHPMSKNMEESFITFLKEHPAEISSADDQGYTLLHRETIAGNQTSVALLLQAGTNKQARTNNGKTALDFARQLNWERLLPLLDN